MKSFREFLSEKKKHDKPNKKNKKEKDDEKKGGNLGLVGHYGDSAGNNDLCDSSDLSNSNMTTGSSDGPTGNA